ncbi:742_t:CDS:2 [Funneliformis mosseae]|uniref:742_t:CDS:1 n=1 Tax=Funneliformis mosseae TaxID=27381 RepID=A0A9N9BPH1_FUNMO|nr:742_t:CDS:2 [Funneliformis mosseae]
MKFEIRIIDLDDNSSEERPSKNAFDLLMKSSTTLFLPEFYPIPRMHWINLMNFINNNGGG